MNCMDEIGQSNNPSTSTDFMHAMLWNLSLKNLFCSYLSPFGSTGSNLHEAVLICLYIVFKIRL